MRAPRLLHYSDNRPKPERRVGSGEDGRAAFGKKKKIRRRQNDGEFGERYENGNLNAHRRRRGKIRRIHLAVDKGAHRTILAVGIGIRVECSVQRPAGRRKDEAEQQSNAHPGQGRFQPRLESLNCAPQVQDDGN